MSEHFLENFQIMIKRQWKFFPTRTVERILRSIQLNNSNDLVYVCLFFRSHNVDLELEVHNENRSVSNDAILFRTSVTNSVERYELSKPKLLSSYGNCPLIKRRLNLRADTHPVISYNHK
jgi:hypothetical protein